jgi:hypothetical protein
MFYYKPTFNELVHEKRNELLDMEVLKDELKKNIYENIGSDKKFYNVIVIIFKKKDKYLVLLCRNDKMFVFNFWNEKVESDKRIFDVIQYESFSKVKNILGGFSPINVYSNDISDSLKFSTSYSIKSLNYYFNSGDSNYILSNFKNSTNFYNKLYYLNDNKESLKEDEKKLMDTFKMDEFTDQFINITLYIINNNKDVLEGAKNSKSGIYTNFLNNLFSKGKNELKILNYELFKNLYNENNKEEQIAPSKKIEKKEQVVLKKNEEDEKLQELKKEYSHKIEKFKVRKDQLENNVDIKNIEQEITKFILLGLDISETIKSMGEYRDKRIFRNERDGLIELTKLIDDEIEKLKVLKNSEELKNSLLINSKSKVIIEDVELEKKRKRSSKQDDEVKKTKRSSKKKELLEEEIIIDDDSKNNIDDDIIQLKPKKNKK